MSELVSNNLPCPAVAYQIISDIGNQLGVMAPFGQIFGRVWSDQAQPEPRVVHTQLVVEIKVLAVVKKHEIKVERRLGFGSLGPDEKVAL